MARALDAALVDVGGTLWPNSWPFRETDGAGRIERLALALPALDGPTVERLGADLIASSRPGDMARSVSTENDVSLGQPAELLITSCLERNHLPADPETIRRIRRAMSIPVHDRMKPLDGALELLQEIHDLGMKTVIASNTYWRDAGSYWEDFRHLGLADHVDQIVTSVDAGHLKPHPAVFEMAMRWAGSPPERCVVIGNREENDIAPAVALRMRSILVYPDDPEPKATLADVAVPDLWRCAEALRTMAGA